MLQDEYSQLLKNLSLEKTGQVIVDAIGKLLNIDIAILHFNKLHPEIEKYFFYQKSDIKSQLDRELLKSTVLPDSVMAFDNSFKIERYELDRDPLPVANYQACLKANIRYILFIPLFSQANLTASVTIHNLQGGNYWQESEIEAARVIATQANLLISQVLVREKLQELAHRETTINRITATIRSSLEPPVMFAAIATELGEALKVDGCTLSLWTKNDRFVKCVGLYNLKELQVIKHTADWQQTTSSVPIAENPILQALLFTKKTVSSSDLQKQRNLARYELPWHSKARALAIVPLLVENEIIGSITLRQSGASRDWTSSELELAEAVANQAAIAITQVLAHQQVKELAHRQTTINRITATIRSSLEPPVMFAAIATELGEALKVDGCTLSLWTKNDRFVKCVGLYNPKEAQVIKHTSNWQQATTSSVPIAENPILQALLFTKKTVSSSDLQKQRNLARYELPWHSKAIALAIVPLLVDDEIIGSITLRQSGASRDWTSSELELAEAVANQAAIAVQQARLYQTTKEQAQQLEIEEQKIRELNNYLTESVLKRFLPEAIVNKAAMGKLSLDLTPEPRYVTILFCDLVGFTTLSSQLEALTLAEILNEYLEAMSKAVFDLGGTVDKFIGDGVMAMFGAPEELPRLEQATRAIATAKTMYYYLQKLNERWQAKVSQTDFEVPLLKMRCGIHQGKAVVGMFGGGQRKDYTAIGKVVNIAARLQSVTSPGSILISEAVANSLNSKIDWGEGQNFKLKGIKRDFRAFTIPICDYSGVDSLGVISSK